MKTKKDEHWMYSHWEEQLMFPDNSTRFVSLLVVLVEAQNSHTMEPKSVDNMTEDRHGLQPLVYSMVNAVTVRFTDDQNEMNVEGKTCPSCTQTFIN